MQNIKDVFYILCASFSISNIGYVEKKKEEKMKRKIVLFMDILLSYFYLKYNVYYFC